MPTHATASLTLGLDPAGREPAYAQIARQIREMIDSGRLAAGTRLPSTRQLALELGVSRITTGGAYEALVAEGFLTSLPRRGHAVADHLPRLAAKRTAERHSRPGTPPPADETPEHGFDSGASVGDFPNARWRRCLTESWRRPDPALLAGRLPGGDPGLRRAIADHLFELRGLRCAPEQILVTAGNRDALMLILDALTRRDRRRAIWLENPGYPPILATVRGLGLNPRPLAVDAEGAVPPAEAPTEPPLAALLTPARQYPLGMALGAERRQQWLARLADPHQRELWLIEDDYDSEFVYQGRPQAPLMSADEAGRTCLVGSFSKSLFRALRLGYIVAPPALLDDLLASQRRLGNAAALPLQPALARFMGEGHYGSHLRRMRRLYLSRRDWLLARLAAMAPELRPRPCPGGMHLVADLAGTPESALIDRARRHGLALDPLSAHYWSGTDQPEGLLLGFTGGTEAQQDTALDRLRLALDETLGTAAAMQ